MAYSSPIVPETKMNGVSGRSSRASESAAMPSKAGIEKSDRMTSGSNSSSPMANACSVSAMRCAMRSPARLSSRTSSSASAATSSVSRTRMAGAVTASVSLRHAVGKHPVQTDLRYCLQKRLELHRLDDVAVDAEPVAFHHVALLVRRGHYHPRNGACLRICLQPPQHFYAIDLRHLDVEHDDLRCAGRIAGGISTGAEHEFERFLAVLNPMHAVREIVPAQRAKGHFGVLRVVLDQQNLHLFQIRHHLPRGNEK